MDSDIQSFRGAASGLLTAQRVRVCGVYMAATAVGTVEFRNGAVGGALLMMLDVSGAANPNVVIPGNGIPFPAGVYIVITGGVSGVTIFCG